MLYNAQLLDWHPEQTGADVLFFDYENVERVELKDMYTNFRCDQMSDFYPDSDNIQLQ